MNKTIHLALTNGNCILYAEFNSLKVKQICFDKGFKNVLTFQPFWQILNMIWFYPYKKEQCENNPHANQ